MANAEQAQDVLRELVDSGISLVQQLNDNTNVGEWNETLGETYLAFCQVLRRCKQHLDQAESESE